VVIGAPRPPVQRNLACTAGRLARIPRVRHQWRSPHDAEIVRLAVPALGALAAEPLYVLADTAVVGHLGTEPLAGLAVASTILLTGHSVFIFLAYGTTAAVARLLGAGEREQAAHQAVQSMWLAAFIGTAVAAVGLVTAPALVAALGATGAVEAEALTYLRISLLGVPALLVTLAGTGYLRGLQDTRTPLVVALGSALLNLVLELALIYGWGFAIGASALATVVAQLAAVAVYLYVVGRDVRAQRLPWRPHGPTIRVVARVGRDLLVRTLALRGSLAVATAVAARTGPIGLAAHQITFEVWNTLAMALDAVAIAAQAIIGRLLGAGDTGEAWAAGRRMLWWGLVTGVVAGGAVGLVHGVLPALFSSDPPVVATAAGLLVIAAVLQPVNGLVFVLDGLLIGAGDAAYLAVAMVVGMVLFVPVAIAVAALGAGVEGLWWAFGVLMGTRLVTLGWRWRRGDWAVTGAVRSGRDPG
jgi:putative MATE family efflux protein